MDLNESPLSVLVPPPPTMKRKSLPMACREFFGIRPGTGFKDFAEELKALTDKDKLDLVEMFRTVGYEVELAQA